MARRTPIIAVLLLLAVPAAAQLALPTPPPVVGQTVDAVVGRAGETLDASVAGVGRRLAAARIDRIDRLVRGSDGRIERDDVGAPARTGELLLIDADDAAIRVASEAGFTLIERERIAELDIDVARLAVPRDMALRTAIRRLRRALPGREITADQLLFASGGEFGNALLNPPRNGEVARSDGGVPSLVMAQSREGDPSTTSWSPYPFRGGFSFAPSPAMATLQASTPARATDTPVGIIDSGIAPAIRLAGSRGFATGAPLAANHGTAVASLLRDAGATRLYAADVYGSDPAGGGSLAVARAIGWLLTQRVRVISISLVGSDNALLRRAVEQASARGTIIVAAVGNDGPAAPPAFPASYPQVIAVTAVDGRNRLLIEAGRALHLDYAAPGTDMRAMAADGRRIEVRGTSFATPLAAARLAHALGSGQTRASAVATLDREALDLGRRGADNRFGRGLLCGNCRATR